VCYTIAFVGRVASVLHQRFHSKHCFRTVNMLLFSSHVLVPTAAQHCMPCSIPLHQQLLESDMKWLQFFSVVIIGSMAPQNFPRPN
jgi:hypothetical protein